MWKYHTYSVGRLWGHMLLVGTCGCSGAYAHACRGWRSTSELILLFVHSFLYMCKGIHVYSTYMSCMWKPKDNLWKFILSFHRVGLGIKPRLPGLVTSAFICCINCCGNTPQQRQLIKGRICLGLWLQGVRVHDGGVEAWRLEQEAEDSHLPIASKEPGD